MGEGSLLSGPRGGFCFVRLTRILANIELFTILLEFAIDTVLGKIMQAGIEGISTAEFCVSLKGIT